MAYSVYRPSLASPLDSSGISVTKYFSERLIKSHFDKGLVLVPPNYDFNSEQGNLLGDEAEKKVIESIRKYSSDIPGIKTICFHGVRVIGGSPPIIREVDQCCFITYQGRYYIIATEVKCNADIKKSGSTRKKAISQLDTFLEMLRDTLNVPTDKLQVHAVWPNMSPTEPCAHCNNSHPSLYEKPEACRQPGTQARASPEPEGFHIFEDKFIGDEFSRWIEDIVTDPSLQVPETVFSTVLDFVARHCVGVLYDEVVKSFCILGEDQAKLVARPEQSLGEPTIIYGLAGTGKTIAILARIQRISGNLGPSSRALYISFGKNAIQMVKEKLEACNIDLTHITFSESFSYPLNLYDLLEKNKVLLNLIEDGYRYVYVDSAEDAGVDWVNKLLAKTLQSGSEDNAIQQGFALLTSTKGDFWITLDPYQGLQDGHSLHRVHKNQLQWMGNLVDANLLEAGFRCSKFVKLGECFRMPHAMINHISSEKVLPTGDLPKAQTVESLGVKQVNISLPCDYSSNWLAEELAEQLFSRVMQRGIHPGHCAVVFDDAAANQLFPSTEGSLPAFVDLVNSKLKAMTANRKAGCMLQISQNIGETLLYSEQEHQQSTPSCVVAEKPLFVEDSAEFQMETHAKVGLL